MPIPLKYLADFEEGSIYHIYNRTNNREALFLNDDNRIFFLKRYKELLTPFVDTYCWCLLSNHFHLLVKMKSNDIIEYFLKSKSITELTIIEKKFMAGKANFSELIEHVFKRFFQSYALHLTKYTKGMAIYFTSRLKGLELKRIPNLQWQWSIFMQMPLNMVS